MVDLTSPSLDSMSGTRGTNRYTVGCSAPLAQRRQTLLVDFLKETPVGVEPTSSCFAGSRLAVWLQRHVKCPRQESNLVLDLRRVACESGTLRGQCCSHVSTSPRSRTPSCRFEVCRAHPSHSQGVESCRLSAISCRPEFTLNDVFADSSTASTSTSARSRTPSASFGGWLLSQEHTRVRRPRQLAHRGTIALTITSPVQRSSTPR